jgi:hypothetical protein
MTQEANVKIGDIIGMSRVTDVKNNKVWGLEYIGKEYIVKRDDKYLLRIHSDANTGAINDGWSSKKWAKHFRPREAGVSIGSFSIESIQDIYNDIEILEVPTNK